MRLNFPKIDVQKLAADVRNAVGLPMRKVLTDLERAVNGELTLQDNLAGTLVTLPLVHGAEYQIPTPRRGVPRFFTPLSSLLADGTPALPVASYSLNPLPRDALGKVVPDKIGLTAQYAPPVGRCHIRRDAAQLIAVATDTKLLMDAETESIGALSFSNNGILLAKSGIVTVTYGFTFVGGALGTRGTWLRTNASTNRYAPAESVPAAIANNWSSAGSFTRDFAEGNTLELWCRQEGVAGGLNTATGVSRPRLVAHYTAPPPNYSANVTGFLWSA